MSDSPMLCANYMVIRRWDEDFMKLAASLRSQFAFNTELMRGLKSLGPRRLTSVSDDELLLQCGLHKRLLKWILAHEVFYSSHDLHAFLGCREEECPSNRTDAVRKFPLYPPRL
ncbi:uncharacterized protein LOC119103864 [Pollicipes pollicipes]|uniref:uncharacterized protein LOC119103864 n=1 Tax=Pollicipes pollicipes TaxID=41117 RepID=UPI0018856299|nr:uncharacterized protein LOC119103864 [Pollicipes pollicipes]